MVGKGLTRLRGEVWPQVRLVTLHVRRLLSDWLPQATPRKWRRHLVTFGARSEYPLRQCLLGSNEVLPKNVAPIEEMAGTDAIQGIE